MSGRPPRRPPADWRTPATGRRARRPPRAMISGSGTGERRTRRRIRSPSMIRNQRAIARPAGAIGTIPAIGRSRFSAARIAAAPPRELPTTTTSPPLSASLATTAATKLSSCSSTGSSSPSDAAAVPNPAGPGRSPAAPAARAPPSMGARCRPSPTSRAGGPARRGPLSAPRSRGLAMRSRRAQPGAPRWPPSLMFSQRCGRKPKSRRWRRSGRGWAG